MTNQIRAADHSFNTIPRHQQCVGKAAHSETTDVLSTRGGHGKGRQARSPGCSNLQSVENEGGQYGGECTSAVMK